MASLRCILFSYLSIICFLCIQLAAIAAGQGYKLVSISQHGNSMEGILQAIRPSSSSDYGADIPLLSLHIDYETPYEVHVHITDEMKHRWEVPRALFPLPDARLLQPTFMDSTELQFSYTENPFGFAITRSSTSETLFNTTPPSSDFNSLIFNDQYLEISTSIPDSASLYGIGESTHKAGLKLSPGSIHTLWNADVASYNTDVNLYGSLPFYMDVRSNGDCHGVLLLNSNGMDVIYESDHLTYRVIGGIFDFYFFSGPSPLKVMEQFTRLVGRPAPMPYWSLGFHQSRFGYMNVTDLETVVASYKDMDIPLEAMWSDIDYMDAYKDFTLDPDNYPAHRLKDFVDKLHSNGQKYVIIIDPGIKVEQNYSTFEHGIEKDIFLKGVDGANYVGQVWPGPVYYLDFFHPNISSFWTAEISNFYKTIPFDGLWIDMNEASNFCSGIVCMLPTDGSCPNLDDQTTCCLACTDANATKWDSPPYKINNNNEKRPIGNRTIATSAVHYGGIREYDAHNLYGFSQAVVTDRALKLTLQKRPFILSRSTFIGAGAYIAHWTGDNYATWNDLAYSIVSVLNSGLFGIPMVGADICGYYGNTTEELCNRWIQLGAFYPFSRDHSDRDAVRQEPYLWDTVAESARKVLRLRYQILPYLYTLVYEAHKMGYPIARPLFFHFADDPVTFTIDTQFLLGGNVLVSPVLTANTTNIEAYFPVGTWYNLLNNSQVISNAVRGSYETLPAPVNTINIHIRNGSILPLQEAALTTAEARKTSFSLIVAFSMSHGESVMDIADGSLFLDNGEDIEMELQTGKSSFISFKASRLNGSFIITSSVREGSFAMQNGLLLERIVVMGTNSLPKKFEINDKDALHRVTVMRSTRLAIEVTRLSLPIGKPFTIQWMI